MLKREDIKEPLRYDILVFTEGRWERHASLDALPSDPAAKYPESAVDLLEIYPNATQADLLKVFAQISDRVPPIMRQKDFLPWAMLWFRLRKLPMTTGMSIGAIPRRTEQSLSHRQRQDPDRPVEFRGKVRSGESKVESKQGTQAFNILWRPGWIHAMDVKFQALPAPAKVIMATLAPWSQKSISRADLAQALLTRPELSEKGWAAFIRYRPLLIKEGFISGIKKSNN